MKPCILLLAAALSLSLTLSACGRKGAPRPPGPPSQVIYPKSYPTE
ncbi:LPS translocon maturation chaperone LptM [Lichenicoccus sp.]